MSEALQESLEFENIGGDIKQSDSIELMQNLSENQLRKIGFFKTNRKRNENWGSAFLAVPENHPIIQKTRPKTLGQILKEAK